MALPISAAAANRSFSHVLREVRGGRAFTVTSHGRPIAKIVPIGADHAVTSAARTALFARLRSSPVQNVESWTRDDLYERGV